MKQILQYNLKSSKKDEPAEQKSFQFYSKKSGIVFKFYDKKEKNIQVLQQEIEIIFKLVAVWKMPNPLINRGFLRYLITEYITLVHIFIS